MSPYYTHRHPDFRENPLEFNPDRWAPEEEAKLLPYAYHPFAVGQRQCIGNSFSLLGSHILLSLLARGKCAAAYPGLQAQIHHGRDARHIEWLSDDHQAPFSS